MNGLHLILGGAALGLALAFPRQALIIAAGLLGVGALAFGALLICMFGGFGPWASH